MEDGGWRISEELNRVFSSVTSQLYHDQLCHFLILHLSDRFLRTEHWGVLTTSGTPRMNTDGLPVAVMTVGGRSIGVYDVTNTDLSSWLV